jgi:tetratricopeptide (TPR) repeat protein
MISKNLAANLAIIGPGGNGKTSIALMILHHPDIARLFGDGRFFVPLEAANSKDMLLQGMLIALGISSGSAEDTSIESTLLSFLRNRKCLLCLDNFETPWENDTRAAEDLLAKITSMSSVAVIITTRGASRPLQTNWTHPLLPPVKPLSQSAALQSWDHLHGGHDGYTLELLEAIEYVPLAVTLLAHLAETESSKDLIQRWNTKKTSMVRRYGVKNRLNNLDTSIELSLQSLRIRENQQIFDFFGILCMLPQGLPTLRIQTLGKLYPDIDIEYTVSVLKQCALVLDSDDFLRVLSPIRLYMVEYHLPPGVLLTTLQKHYVKMAKSTDFFDNATTRELLRLELQNTRSILHFALSHAASITDVIDAVIKFSAHSRYLNAYDVTLLDNALAKSDEISAGQKADCLYEKGMIQRFSHDLSASEENFKSAYMLHYGIGDLVGLANDLNGLGNIYRRTDCYGAAEESLSRALALHREIGDQRGEAGDVSDLGHIHLQRDCFDAAEECYESALALHRQIGDRKGEAIGLKGLGDVYLRKDRVDAAEECYQSALAFHRQFGDRKGEAIDLYGLGDVHLRKERVDAAEECYGSALALHRQFSDRQWEAYDLKGLGDVHLRKDRVDAAEECYQSALALHRQIGDRKGEAIDLYGLGNVHLRKDRVDAAEECYQSALAFHRQIGDRRGEANDLYVLGQVHLRKDCVDAAEECYRSALALHHQISDRQWEAYDLKDLGDVHLRKGRVDAAEECYQSALALHRQIGDQKGEAIDLYGIGQVYLRKKRLDAAEECCQSALALHRQIGDSQWEAIDLHNLGYIYFRANKLDAAHEYYNKALGLYRAVSHKRNEANVLYMLATITLKTDCVEQAKSLLNTSLKLCEDTGYESLQSDILKKLKNL